MVQPPKEGCPPGCEDLSESARVLHVDALTVYSTLLCCLPATGGGPKGRQFVLGQQRIIGPQGGCVGLEQTVTVALPPCPPCTTRELV